MMFSWCELFECNRLDMIEIGPKIYLGCQMTIPVYEVSGGGQSCQMQTEIE